MLHLLWLVPVLPLVGFAILALTTGRLPHAAISWIGSGSVGLSALVAILISFQFLGAADLTFHQVGWTWFDVAGFRPAIGLYLDALSLVMMLVVTIVSFLIHLYSTEYMAEDEGYNRYFAYMNLFVASMCVLVLADNLLFLYLGWEGVGLCSYLLIGFWYRDPVNGSAAQKAFIVTRAGDAAMMLGLFLLFTHQGTLEIQPLMQRASADWSGGSNLAIAAAALLLGGAVGKSAQLPLQTWLPDAMAGPTPVSALIHAAAVPGRAGGRAHLAPCRLQRAGAERPEARAGVFDDQPDRLHVPRARCRCLVGGDLPPDDACVLQSAAVPLGRRRHHGAARRARHPQDGRAAQEAADRVLELPDRQCVAGGFYSKDLILWHAWSSADGSPWLWAAGWVGALLTGGYIFRAVFLVFFGSAKTAIGWRPGWRSILPLVVLSVLSVVGGWIELPPFLGDVPLFTHFVQHTLPVTPLVHGGEAVIEWLAVIASLGGIFAAYWLFMRHPQTLERWMQSAAAQRLRAYWHGGWGFDWLYDHLFVRPYLWLADIDRDDIVDSFYTGIAQLCMLGYGFLSASQDGRVRRYAAAIGAGGVIVVAIALFA